MCYFLESEHIAHYKAKNQHTHSRMHARTHTHAHTHTSTHSLTHSHTHTHARTHARTHTHTHTFVHTLHPNDSCIKMASDEKRKVTRRCPQTTILKGRDSRSRESKRPRPLTSVTPLHRLAKPADETSDAMFHGLFIHHPISFRRNLALYACATLGNVDGRAV